MEKLKCEYHPSRKASFIGSSDTTFRFQRTIRGKKYSYPCGYYLCTDCAKLVMDSENKKKAFLYALVG